MRKLIVAVVLGAFLLSTPALAETMVYGGAQMLVKGGDTKELGGGSVLRIGKTLSPRVIAWADFQAYKTGEGISVDNGFIGVSLLTETLVPAIKSGVFLTVEGGFGKLEDEPVNFASLTNAGLYFDFTDKTRLWVGGAYSHTADLNVYSAQVGLSLNVDWAPEPETE